MIIKDVPAGSKGFDINSTVTERVAALFKENGFAFCIRYIPRTPSLITGNLTKEEIDIILNAGLSLGVVQHCHLPNWLATGSLGAQYGQYAAEYAKGIGLREGVNVWLDLEMVSLSSTAEDVIDYCHEWSAALAEAQYNPALYVGFQTRLTPDQLYEALPFTNYWRAYNGDDVSKRGFQILQGTARALNGISYDPNTVQADAFGSLPAFIFSSD